MKLHKVISCFLITLFICGCRNPSDTTNDNTESPLTGTYGPDTNAIINPADHPMLSILSRVGEQMEELDKPEDFDMCFARLMIIHHEGTIQLAQYALEKLSVEELKNQSRVLIEKHAVDNRKLKEHIDHHKTGILSSEIHEDLMNVIRQSKARISDDNLTGDPERDYAELMLIHLENGVDLATQQVLNGHHVQIKLLAKKMLSEMQDEQEKLSSFLSKI